MPKITINKNKCKGCLLCVTVCPKGAIGVHEELNPSGFKAAHFKEEKGCISCKKCAIICPDSCIEVYRDE